MCICFFVFGFLFLFFLLFLTTTTSSPVRQRQSRFRACPAPGSIRTPCMPASKPDRQRICLFGGTFDPIHCAHLRIAEEAAERFALDRVLFIPAGIPPHKVTQVVAPSQDRLAMVELACAGPPRFH